MSVCCVISSYVHKLSDYLFQGQEWIDNVRRCLKIALLSNTAVYNSRNCNLIEDYAFSTHPTCYVNNGFCKIITSLRNIRGLLKVFDFSDFLTKRAIAQVTACMSI